MALKGEGKYMKKLLKSKYEIDFNTRLSSEPESLRVIELVSMLRQNGVLNKEEALKYLDNITYQLIIENKDIKETRMH